MKNHVSVCFCLLTFYMISCKSDDPGARIRLAGCDTRNMVFVKKLSREKGTIRKFRSVYPEYTGDSLLGNTFFIVGNAEPTLLNPCNLPDDFRVEGKAVTFSGSQYNVPNDDIIDYIPGKYLMLSAIE